MIWYSDIYYAYDWDVNLDATLLYTGILQERTKEKKRKKYQ